MTTKHLTGGRLLRTAVNLILSDPNCLQQDIYHSPCETKHCIAGLCQILAGFEADSMTARADAEYALGIKNDASCRLFNPFNTLSELYHFAQNFETVFAGNFDVTFDEDGFDFQGFNRNGFDRQGFNREGYNYRGYDRTGFDRSGFSNWGYNRDNKRLATLEI